ncbi:isoquinoline 1-oxidoreductase, alpha subunit [Granulicella rosea]|uniref:Isoquinoline 1-oxidoreductase, alpha subunit n=1 Tax=Granulicella rosea TaxID=474952 RepID=A0A239M9K0_9BACT|nr:(2Fe-2S)-binding protein [Granulicella rosea]SNT38773.1 isoquinoline 1-oxidoreductase, alpha subunit [Granulicella rosea]
MPPYKLNINKKTVSVDAVDDMPLLWVLRDVLDLKGTKYGCGVSECGACTVLIDGRSVRSCQIAVSEAQGAITTIEGLAENGKLHVVQQTWVDLDVAQCGYCQGGQILSAVALLTAHPQPTDAEIDTGMSHNLCRCATYNRIREAIHHAAGMKSAAKGDAHAGA